MKKCILILIFILFIGVLSSCKEKETPPEETDYSLCKAAGYDYDPTLIDDYELVWYDEFDLDGTLNKDKWGYDLGGSGWGNNELQYYTEDLNSWVEDGHMIIEARKESYMGRDYTSARVISKNKGDWLYGKIEVMAKLPTGVGTWPAIWMLPTDWLYGGWPSSGEIDIMEHVGYDQNKVHGSIHTKFLNHQLGTQRSGTRIIETASTEFHKYAIEWLPDRIKFYIDDHNYFTFQPNRQVPCPTLGQWPFDARFHLLLNIAVGGNWGGVEGVDDEIFPQRMEIDYVRVYQSDFIANLQKG
ncbi:MAG: glycoside hydrolase family 16 protein [Acholeplasmataceae bacterium]|jgi:beta-glucanase (GH16 family)|nr:glycoside hydrolase family 16 protein [Acholeplasmataceae bacterium]